MCEDEPLNCPKCGAQDSLQEIEREYGDIVYQCTECRQQISFGESPSTCRTCDKSPLCESCAENHFHNGHDVWMDF